MAPKDRAILAIWRGQIQSRYFACRGASEVRNRMDLSQREVLERMRMDESILLLIEI
jgi:hypothetical protein